MLPLVAVCLSALKTSYETTVPEHISDLMPLYLDPHLNREWNQRMSTQQFVHSREHGGDLVHQTYRLPWPLKTRELVMHCIHDIKRSSNSVTATCHSVDTSAVPQTPDNVRMEILESKWTFTALANGKTNIKTHILISEEFSVGVPSFVIKFVQDNSLKESVKEFLKAARRLRLPPHPTFIAWRRSREQARLAASKANIETPSAYHSAHGAWGAATHAALSLCTVLAAVAVQPRLTSWWHRRRTTTRAVRKLGRAVSRHVAEVPPRVPMGSNSSSGHSSYARAQCDGLGALLSGGVDCIRIEKSCSLSQLERLEVHGSALHYSGPTTYEATKRSLSANNLADAPRGG